MNIKEPIKIIGFIPPIVGVEDTFNTFRLGAKLSKSLTIGDKVYLANDKEKEVFGEAIVVGLDLGRLDEMCVIHGEKNHTEIGNDDGQAPERLFKLLQKIYGPQVAMPTKKTTVIYLKRIK